MKNPSSILPKYLPPSEWATEDQAAWARALRIADPLDEPGLASHWAAATQEKVARSYGYYAAWVQASQPGSRGGFPDIANATNVRGFVESMTDQLSPFTILGYLTDLREFGRVAWPNAPHHHLSTAVSYVRARAKPVRNKAERLVGLGALYDLGISLMHGPQSGVTQDNRIPLAQFRDGMAIALLAMRPLRIRAFGSLQLDCHLVRQKSSWRMVVPAELSKSRKHWEADVPEDLVYWLDRYVGEIRPQLLALRGRWYAAPGSALWISIDGSALRPKALGEAITKRTKAAFGHAIPPHFFRDEAVTELARSSPTDVSLATPLLGHSSLRTTERHYNQAQSIDAARKFQDVQKQLRKKLAK